MRRALAAIALVITGGLGQAVLTQENTSRCPTEDSCTVDYDHGVWTLREDRP